jgi:hypothetical protein
MNILRLFYRNIKELATTLQMYIKDESFQNSFWGVRPRPAKSGLQPLLNPACAALRSPEKSTLIGGNRRNSRLQRDD